MTLWVCLDCTAAYSVGAPLCPQCGSERHAEQGAAAALGVQHGVPVGSEEDGMPKITRHGGASVAGEEPETETEGGEDVSAGTSSETSSEKPSLKPGQSGSETPRRVRTTGSRSKKAGTDRGSSASSVGGGLGDGTSETDDSDGGDGA